VYVVLPLLPAFEGEIGANGGYAIQAVLHWNYMSISKGENSLWQQLIKKGNSCHVHKQGGELSLATTHQER